MTKRKQNPRARRSGVLVSGGLSERAHCGKCGILEGELHCDGCSMECCAFCGGQRVSCGCDVAHFHPDYRTLRNRIPENFAQMTEAERAASFGLPLAVYNSGLPPEQQAEWAGVEAEKGRVPFILYPNICRRCGALWPEMFSVSDEEWERYVQPDERDEMLCLGCYRQIKGYIDGVR